MIQENQVHIQYKNSVEYNKSYKEPECDKDYYHSYFIQELKKFEDQDETKIVCSCKAPRWCHPIPKSKLETKANQYDSFIQEKYCGLFQVEIMNRYSDEYKTKNGLCVPCLQNGICCFFDYHPLTQVLELCKKRPRYYFSKPFFETVDCTIFGLFDGSIKQLFSCTLNLSTPLSSSLSENFKLNFTFKDFEMLSINFDDFSNPLSDYSNFLLLLKKNCKNMYYKKKRNMDYPFDNESDIQFLVHNLLIDLCSLINFKTGIGSPILEIKTKVKFGKKSPDFFILEMVSKETKPLPVMIIQVKSPGAYILECYEEHQKQLKNYMRLIRKEYGIVDIYGVLTDFEKWIFFWFEESDNIVNPDDNKNNPILNNQQSLKYNKDSKIFNSSVVGINHFDFSISFLTFLSHSINVRNFDNEFVPSIESGDLIEVIQNKTFHLINLSKGFDNIEFCFENYDKNKLSNIINQSTLYNLKFLNKGRDGQTFIMSYCSKEILSDVQNSELNLTTNLFSLIVVKIMNNLNCPYQDKYNLKNHIYLDKKIENEIYGWRCFGIDILNSKISLQMSNSGRIEYESLILPYCFTIINVNNERKFDFNFSIFNNFKSSPNYNITYKELLKNASIEWSNKDSVDIAMNKVLEIMWENEIDHKDIKWDHLGLIPKFENNNLILIPVLFDFSDIKKLNKNKYNNIEEYKNNIWKLLNSNYY